MTSTCSGKRAVTTVVESDWRRRKCVTAGAQTTAYQVRPSPDEEEDWFGSISGMTSGVTLKLRGGGSVTVREEESADTVLHEEQSAILDMVLRAEQSAILDMVLRDLMSAYSPPDRFWGELALLLETPEWVLTSELEFRSVVTDLRTETHGPSK